MIIISAFEDLFNPTNDQDQISPHNIEKNKLLGKDFKNL